MAKAADNRGGTRSGRGHGRRRDGGGRREAGLASYWDRAQWPLQSLYFLLPLLIVYEVGTVIYAPPGLERLPAIVAESLLMRFFELFGVAGVYLPGVLVVLVLLGWHVMRRDPWLPEPKLYLAMLIEAAMLTAPLLVLSVVVSRSVENPAGPAMMIGGLTAANPLPSANPADYGWHESVLFSLGAGIYEELLFRLIMIAVVHLILVDVLGFGPKTGAVIAVLVSAVTFAWYHFTQMNPAGWSAVQWGRFVFYVLAGVYFAGIYVLRGFGIVAVVHALYDVVVVSQQHWG